MQNRIGLGMGPRLRANQQLMQYLQPRGRGGIIPARGAIRGQSLGDEIGAGMAGLGRGLQAYAAGQRLQQEAAQQQAARDARGAYVRNMLGQDQRAAQNAAMAATGGPTMAAADMLNTARGSGRDRRANEALMQLAETDQDAAFNILSERMKRPEEKFGLISLYNQDTGETRTLVNREENVAPLLRRGNWIEADLAPEPESEAGGPFSGTSMDAQSMNILLDPNADTSSAQYRAVYNRMAAPKITFDPATGRQVIVRPDMSAYRRPTGMAQTSATATEPQGDEQVSTAQGGVTIEQVAEPTKPLTEGQANAATFADRMRESHRIITSLEGVSTDLGQRLATEVPIVGNYLLSDDYQKLQQAKEDFINANLREESGATIQDEEFARADRQYFPQPGDSDAVIRQKRRNRQLALEGLVRAAGPMYRPNVLEQDDTDGESMTSRIESATPEQARELFNSMSDDEFNAMSQDDARKLLEKMGE